MPSSPIAIDGHLPPASVISRLVWCVADTEKVEMTVVVGAVMVVVRVIEVRVFPQAPVRMVTHTSVSISFLIRAN